MCVHTQVCVFVLPSDSSLLSQTLFQIAFPFSVFLICIKFFSFFYSWSKLFFGAFSFLPFFTLTILLQALGMY